MNESNREGIGLLIELAITGQADVKQSEELVARLENGPGAAGLYQQARAEHRLLEGRVPAAGPALEQERRRQQAKWSTVVLWTIC